MKQCWTNDLPAKDPSLLQTMLKMAIIWMRFCRQAVQIEPNFSQSPIGATRLTSREIDGYFGHVRKRDRKHNVIKIKFDRSPSRDALPRRCSAARLFGRSRDCSSSIEIVARGRGRTRARLGVDDVDGERRDPILERSPSGERRGTARGAWSGGSTHPECTAVVLRASLQSVRDYQRAWARGEERKSSEKLQMRLSLSPFRRISHSFGRTGHGNGARGWRNRQRARRSCRSRRSTISTLTKSSTPSLPSSRESKR